MPAPRDPLYVDDDITWTDVEAYYPALAGVADAVQDDILAYVNDEALSASVFGGATSTKYRLARIYLAGHIAESQARAAGVAGPVQSKTIAAESLSVTYGSFSAASVQLLTTAPGSALYQLMQMSPRARLFIPRGCP